MNALEYLNSVIRNEKVGCSIHLSGTRYKKAQFARLGFLLFQVLLSGEFSATETPYNASIPITCPIATPGSPDSMRPIV